MAYEKLAVVYDYRDDDFDGDEENDESTGVYSEKVQYVPPGDTSGKYDKLSSTSPKKKMADPVEEIVNSKVSSPHSPEVERKTIGDRVLGVMSNVSEGLSNWFLLTASNAAVVDSAFMYGGDSKQTFDQINRPLAMDSRRRNRTPNTAQKKK